MSAEENYISVGLRTCLKLPRSGEKTSVNTFPELQRASMARHASVRQDLAPVGIRRYHVFSKSAFRRRSQPRLGFFRIELEMG
jgi:hypothetical protein